MAGCGPTQLRTLRAFRHAHRGLALGLANGWLWPNTALYPQSLQTCTPGPGARPGQWLAVAQHSFVPSEPSDMHTGAWRWVWPMAGCGPTQLRTLRAFRHAHRGLALGLANGWLWPNTASYPQSLQTCTPGPGDGSGQWLAVAQHSFVPSEPSDMHTGAWRWVWPMAGCGPTQLRTLRAFRHAHRGLAMGLANGWLWPNTASYPQSLQTCTPGPGAASGQWLAVAQHSFVLCRKGYFVEFRGWLSVVANNTSKL
ncbi:hypothetical protein NDU88_001951 [Pleurodeles waltl]|uniref:Uncharacterized protein n=1 Tax=Pleurodeles waltl TaxID=8319 RepID=A0AAV7RD29_PLEWA|nr:hypothetical protein NDU88_001951 [Pleurodeles waltl]